MAALRRVVASCLLATSAGLVPRAMRPSRRMLLHRRRGGLRRAQELLIDVADCGPKGMGAFAAEDRGGGSWVCDYVGETIDFVQRATRYQRDPPDYLFHLGGGAIAGSHLYVDAVNSTHASRSINHAQHGNLEPRVDLKKRRVAFYALRDISKGDELTFDYGVEYWFERGFAPADDDRDYSPERLAAERKKLAEAQRSSQGEAGSNPLSRRRRRDRAPSTAAALAAVLRERPEPPAGPR